MATHLDMPTFYLDFIITSMALLGLENIARAIQKGFEHP